MERCPCCGFAGLTEPPWVGTHGSDEICVCCGLHFGYDDMAGGDPRARPERYRVLREQWRSRGCPWFSQATPAPAGWDPIAQLASVSRASGQVP